MKEVQKKYQTITLIALVTLAIGATFYHSVEKLTWVDAFYFSVVTLATVGYGDIAPKTDLGKIFTIFYILTGIGIIGAFINSLVKRAAQRRENRQKKKRS